MSPEVSSEEFTFPGALSVFPTMDLVQERCHTGQSSLSVLGRNMAFRQDNGGERELKPLKDEGRGSKTSRRNEMTRPTLGLGY